MTNLALVVCASTEDRGELTYKIAIITHMEKEISKSLLYRHLKRAVVWAKIASLDQPCVLSRNLVVMGYLIEVAHLTGSAIISLRVVDTSLSNIRHLVLVAS